MEIKKGINNNGYDYVGLGLPSGTLWATCNIGASKPSESGMYFQWGDTKGYTKYQVGTGDGQKKFALDWSDYKWYLSGSGVDLKFKKYTVTGATLELEDDAAHVNMGGDWHIPTPNQIKEFLSNTTSTWTTQDGINGRSFTSKSDSSKSIFIPATGIAWEGSVYGSGEGGFIWSSTLNNGGIGNGQVLACCSDSVSLFSYVGRFDGLPIRGVIG